MGPLRSLALVLLVAAPARAAPAQEPAPTAEAATLTGPQTIAWDAAMAEVEAMRQGDREAALRCAAGFLAVHIELPPEHPRALVSLYNAAQCQTAAGLWGDAAALYRRILARWPTSDLARLALAELARGHEAFGRYADAADFAEQYAARYPDDEQTPDLLRDAYRMRVAFDQRGPALAILDRLVAHYRRRDPAQAAEMFWRRRELLRTDPERLAHAMAYLEHHGKSGPRDLLVVASAQLGALHWQAACAKGSLDDLCVTIHRRGVPVADEGPRDRARVLRDRARRLPRRPRPPPAPPPTCRRPTTPLVVVHPRDPGAAVEARRWFTQALALARRHPLQLPADDLPRIRAYHDALARVDLHLADAMFEELLALPVPTDLAFTSTKREDSLRRFAAYLTATRVLTQQLERRYGDIATARTAPAATIAALARLGQLAEYRAAALLLTPLPAELSTAQVAAVCAAMHEQVEPLLAAAVAAYARCLDTAITTGHFTDFARLAERALLALAPREWPELAELVGAAEYTTSRPDIVGIVEAAPVQGPIDAGD